MTIQDSVIDFLMYIICLYLFFGLKRKWLILIFKKNIIRVILNFFIAIFLFVISFYLAFFLALPITLIFMFL